ncbi:MAG: DUF362 domain-containing protein [Chloroflexi bacterium]|nr:DUF362 domain-containing protein [Chloroflexota bacterium]
MTETHTHEIFSHDATVHIVTGETKFDALHQALEQSGFVDHLLAHWGASDKTKAAFRIAIKPNIMTTSIHQPDSPVYTDPALVEDLIRLIKEQGFTQISVVESQNVYNYAYTGRTVPAVAALCGYSGDGYQIVDLTEDTVPFDYGGVMGQHIAGRAWLEADYRISFAKNKTHWQCFYTACLKNVYGCLPAWDKMKVYHGKGRRGRDIEFFQATILINEKLPPHFALLDAWISGDGLTGHVRDAKPNPTHTIFASENAYALDWVAGEKMQIDPPRNYVIQEAIRHWGTIQITRVGDMTAWTPWLNVRSIVVRAFDLIEEFYWLGRFMSRTAATQSDPRFPQVGRFSWFFRITQAFVRVIEPLVLKATDPNFTRKLPF